MNETVITQAEEGTRIDVAVSAAFDVTRSAAQRLLEDGAVTVNGARVAKNYRVKPGDRVCCDIPAPAEWGVAAQDIPLDIVYEDGDLLVVNKPQGMVVHPAAGNPDGTLVNALMHHCAGDLSGIGGVLRPGIVHRIDKDTSGLLLVAKTDRAHLSLAAQIKAHSVTREYAALVHGNVREDAFTVDKPIGRSPKDRKKMAVVPDGRTAVTHVTVQRRYPGYTLVTCRLETGRTHQIRVHMKSMGHSVVGDPVYGNKKESFGLAGQLLHARLIGFAHPVTGAYMEFSAPLPAQFQRILQQLEEK